MVHVWKAAVVFLLALFIPKCAPSATNTSVIGGTDGNSSPGHNVSNCTLGAQDGFRDQLARYLSQGSKLVEMTVRFQNHPPDVLHRWLKGVYKPHLWVRSTSRKGRSLLVLEENYSFMSLSTLTIGVARMDVNVSDSPAGCLQWLDPRDTLQVIRSAFLADFGVLLVLVLTIKVLVVLYTPMFLPESLYRLKYKASEFIYHVPDDPVTLKVVVTQDPLSYGEENKDKRVHLSDLHHMEYFKAMVSGNRWQQDKVYEVKVKEVRLAVKIRRLLDQFKVPVGLLSLLYTNIFRCRIRRLAPLKTCCETSILGNFTPPNMAVMKWSTCMRTFAGYLVFFLISLPWIFRVGIFFWFESDLNRERYKAAEASGLELGFTGNFIMYLSPLHAFFLVIYVIVLVDSLVYGALTKAMKEKFNIITRQCLRDMRERSRMTVVNWLVKLLVLPFTAFGLFGFFLFPLYFLLVMLMALPFLAFYLLPFLNLSVRLILHIIIFICPQRVHSKCEQWSARLVPFKKSFPFHEVTANETFIQRHLYSSRGILLQLMVVTMCLFSFWSVTLLLTEVISFVVELVMYTFMGIIVNAGVTLQYISVIFLLFLYAKNTFSGVSKLYLNYHKTIHTQLLAMKKEEIDAVAVQEETTQQSTAFMVVGDMTSVRPRFSKPILKVKNRIPQWTTSGMLVFLDNLDTPYTPEKFFYETIHLNYFDCPGPIYHNLLLAIWDFTRILVFLLFVLIIVMAFGDAYNISTTNQLLATVVGGIIPFIFRNILMSGGAVTELDTSNVQFRTELHQAINSYEQLWPVYDIIPTQTQEAALETGSIGNSGNANSPTISSQSQPPIDSDARSRQVPVNTADFADWWRHSTVTGQDQTQEKTSVISRDQKRIEIDLIVDVSMGSAERNQRTSFLYRNDPNRGSVSMLNNSSDYRDTIIEFSHTRENLI